MLHGFPDNYVLKIYRLFTVVPTIIYSKSTFDTLFLWECYGNAMGMLYRLQAPPSTVRLVVIACGASAVSEKTRPGLLEHVSCGCCRYLNNFVVIRAGGTWVQGLVEPAGGFWGNRWAG